MGTILSLDSVSCQIGNKKLFDKIKLVISDNSRLAVIGPNGSGKSTLLKIMAGIISPDQGNVVSGSTKIVYIPQIDSFDPNLTIKETIINELKNEISIDEVEIKVAKFLSQLEFNNLDDKISSLSGGWRKRLSLAIALAQEPELLLLDEPTNHLDLKGLLWLENLLATSKFAWVLISHDRYFLDRTVKEVVEIAPWYKNGIMSFSGTYSIFTEKRETYFEQEAKEIASLTNKFKTEVEWASRAPKARTTKASYRLKEVDKLNEVLKEKKSRVQTENKKVSFTSSSRQTKDLVEFINASFSFENKPIIKNFEYLITSGSCLGILGTNGQGKSTLLKLIGGELNVSSGKIKRANFLKIVYFDQLRKKLEPNEKLRNIFSDGSDQVLYQGKPVHIISWAKRFGFQTDDLDKNIASLSGGEQARALLSILVRQEGDLLILDEPTNDLDIQMLETLEIMLNEFNGGIVLVTHDRFMLENVCTEYLGYTEDQELLTYASYQQWEDLRKTQEPAKAKTVKKISEAERKELVQVERKIIKAEEELAKIELKAADPTLYEDPNFAQKIALEIKESKEKITLLYQRWDELA